MANQEPSLTRRPRPRGVAGGASRTRRGHAGGVPATREAKDENERKPAAARPCSSPSAPRRRATPVRCRPGRGPRRASLAVITTARLAPPRPIEMDRTTADAVLRGHAVAAPCSGVQSAEPGGAIDPGEPAAWPWAQAAGTNSRGLQLQLQPRRRGRASRTVEKLRTAGAQRARRRAAPRRRPRQVPRAGPGQGNARFAASRCHSVPAQRGVTRAAAPPFYISPGPSRPRPLPFPGFSPHVSRTAGRESSPGF